MNKFNALVMPETKVIDAIKLMSSSEVNKFIAGTAVVVDGNKKVLGILSDGDIRRGLNQGLNTNATVKEMANFNPVTVSRHLSPRQMQVEIVKKAKDRQKSYLNFSKIILTDDDNTFYDLVQNFEIFDTGIENKIIGVYGLGFVGLTLSAVFANNDLIVTGIDSNQKVIESLKAGKPHFYEKGLESLLSFLNKKNPIRFVSNPDEASIDVHIVSVGTPLSEAGKPELEHLTEVTRTISKKIKKNDLVIYRSTVPVGTTRTILIPILEENQLIAGQDFYVAFAPERTVEGNALQELSSLPQIIGGINHASVEMASKLFNKITATVVEVSSLEEAEIAKLINNTHRDLTFSFANEIAYICDHFNINAFKLIEAANEGYPRNPIAKPSPGVGGICLSKDPILYSNPYGKLNRPPVLGKISRQINSIGDEYVLEKINEYCKITSKDLKKLKIFLIGLAFKGMPETSDIRNSVALDLLKKLPNPKNIYIKDFVVPKEIISSLGHHPVDQVIDGFKDADIVLIMNNHYQNNRFDIFQALNSTKENALFFDGWNLFDPKEIEGFRNTVYATMGYISKNEKNK